MRKIDLAAEAKFENRKASGENVRSKQNKYYWATALPIHAHIKQSLDVIKNKEVLEIGCASGRDAAQYAKSAEKYIGIDISEVAIANCRKLSLENASFMCGDGHRIPADNGSIDYIIVNSLLHHLDLSAVFPEICRVLKNDGGLIFREPLGTNPLFQLYRHLTPRVRTIDERPFTFSDLALMRSHFQFETVDWFGFSNILSAFIKVNSVRLILTKADRLIANTPLKYLCWQFSGIARPKRQN